MCDICTELHGKIDSLEHEIKQAEEELRTLEDKCDDKDYQLMEARDATLLIKEDLEKVMSHFQSIDFLLSELTMNVSNLLNYTERNP